VQLDFNTIAMGFLWENQGFSQCWRFFTIRYMDLTRHWGYWFLAKTYGDIMAHGHVK
jgi:hypothetical protein